MIIFFKTPLYKLEAKLDMVDRDLKLITPFLRELEDIKKDCEKSGEEYGYSYDEDTQKTEFNKLLRIRSKLLYKIQIAKGKKQ